MREANTRAYFAPLSVTMKKKMFNKIDTKTSSETPPLACLKKKLSKLLVKIGIKCIATFEQRETNHPYYREHWRKEKTVLFSGLYYNCFTFVIYDRNDSGQYYKTTITIVIDDCNLWSSLILTIASVVNYDHKWCSKLWRHLQSSFMIIIVL